MIVEGRFLAVVEEEIAETWVQITGPVQHNLGSLRELWFELPQKALSMFL